MFNYGARKGNDIRIPWDPIGIDRRGTVIDVDRCHRRGNNNEVPWTDLLLNRRGTNIRGQYWTSRSIHCIDILIDIWIYLQLLKNYYPELCIVNERWKESRKVGEIQICSNCSIINCDIRLDPIAIGGCWRKNYWVSRNINSLMCVPIWASILVVPFWNTGIDHLIDTYWLIITFNGTI